MSHFLQFYFLKKQGFINWLSTINKQISSLQLGCVRGKCLANAGQTSHWLVNDFLDKRYFAIYFCITINTNNMSKNSPVETAVQKKEMIDALESNFGNVTIAARVVGITPRTHYRWLKEDDAYSTEAENIKDICYRKIKDGLIQKALMKIEKGSTRVLLKMLGIFLKKMPEEMERASRINNVRLVPKIKYVTTREEAQEIMRSRGEMPNKID